jgi:hypothetical protein
MRLQTGPVAHKHQHPQHAGTPSPTDRTQLVAAGVAQDVGSLVYGWRPNGPSTWAEGGRFHPAYVMLDPYCPRVLPVVLPQVCLGMIT